jgi:hypothetical protein
VALEVRSNPECGGSKMVTGTQTQTAWAPWIRDLAETLVTHVPKALAPWTPSLWKDSSFHSILKEKAGHHPHATTPCQPVGLQGLHPTGPLGHLPSAHWASTLWARQATITTRGLQHHQTPAPNMPRRHRQIRLDAKGITTRTTKTEILLFLN